MTTPTKSPSSSAPLKAAETDSEQKKAFASSDAALAAASVTPVADSAAETRVPLPERPDYEVPLHRRLNPYQRGLEEPVPAQPIDRVAAMEDTRTLEQRQADHDAATKEAVADGSRILDEKNEKETKEASKA